MNIILKDVYFNYNNKKVLNNVSLEIKDGQSIAIIGPSGCGKTTLLHIISGLLKPTSGFISNISDSGCSMVFQENRLLDNLTVYENLQLVQKDLTHHNASLILKQLGLENTADLYPSSLSGGMKQRVSIIRAIIFGKSPVIMDEPFSGLDSETKKSIMEFIKINIADKIFIFTTHEPKDAEIFHSRILELNNKKEDV